jgi:putative copper export protein
MADALSVALLALTFLLVLQAAGIALFVAIFAGRLSASLPGVRRIGRLSAVLAIAAAAGHYVLRAGRMAGDLSGIWDRSLQMLVLHSASAAQLALQTLGLVLVLVGLRAGTGAARAALAQTAGTVGATLAVVAFALTGHTVVSPARWLLVIALTAHALVVAFWLGALLPIRLATLRESPLDAAKLVADFSAIATWLVPVILLAGLLLALGLVPSLATFRQPYGELLLVKLAGFGLLMLLAAANRWRLAPAIGRGQGRAGAALRRSIEAEYVLIAGVLAATAVMTTFFSPD